MEGFFKKRELASSSCGISCKLHRGCNSPKMPVTGQGKMGILIIAEAPGEQEDKQNTQLVGPAGKLLREALSEFGVDLDRDCRKTNAVRCRPPKNRKPDRTEIESCSHHIWEEISLHPPKLIIILGQVAMEGFLLDRCGKHGSSPIGTWRGFAIPDQKAKAWVCPTFHPSYILRSQEGRSIRGKGLDTQSVEELTFRRDLEGALRCLNKPFLVAPSPKILMDFSWTKEPFGMLAIDYETTGLTPYKKGHRIVSVGFSNGVWATAVEMSNSFAKIWKYILAEEKTLKIAHNMKFESKWAQHCLGVETKGWHWDTMLAGHVLDNRRGITSLDAQAYIHLGVESWKMDTNETFGEDSDGFNRYEKEVTPQLLRRNALDSFYTFLLCHRLKERFQ